MRRLVLALAVLLPALAAGSGRSIRDGEIARSGMVADRDPTLLLFLPLNWTGPLIGDDAGTVAHVYWDGSALVDTKGLGWAMVGTVPQVSASVSPFTPGRAGSGVYSDANYYTLGAGSDVLDFTGDFSACFVFVPPTTFAASPAIFDNGAVATSGYIFFLDTGGRLSSFSYSSGQQAISGNSVVTYGINVACGGRSGVNFVSKLNVGTYASQAAAYVADTTSVATLGRMRSAAGRYFPGTLYEAWFSTTTPSDALFTAIIKRVFGQLNLAVTRSGSATYQQNGRLWNTPTNVMRVTSDGTLNEISRTNSVVQSDEITTAAGWTKIGTTEETAQNVQDYGWGVNTMEQLTAKAAGCGISRGVTITSSTGPFTASAWVASVAGTATHNVALVCGGAGTPTISGCARSDLGSCATAVLGNTAIASATVGTTPVRLSITATCSVATTSPIIQLGPDASPAACVANDTGYYGGAQFEVGGFPTSYIPTTTTSLVRNGDSISFPNTLEDGSHFCLRSTAKPEVNTFWNGISLAANLGGSNGFAAPNVSVTTVFWQVYDSTTAVRTCYNITALSPTVSYTFRQSMFYPGLLGMSANGVVLPCSFVGAGTAIMSGQPPTISFNSNAWHHRDVQLYRTGTCR